LKSYTLRTDIFTLNYNVLHSFRYDIATWRHAINRATHPVHTFGRYEVSTKMNVAPLVPEDSGKLAYTTPGYWEPWVMGWLTRLVKLDMSPHFLQLLGTFRCNDLPGKYTGMPEEGATGIMPPYSPGGPVTRAIEQIKVDGDSFQVREAGRGAGSEAGRREVRREGGKHGREEKEREKREREKVCVCVCVGTQTQVVVVCRY
jgi:hypothetical protein